jgi:hypothetical protein
MLSQWREKAKEKAGKSDRICLEGSNAALEHRGVQLDFLCNSEPQ